MKNKLQADGEPAEVTSKELFQAYKDAETAQKFTNTKGMTGVKRDNELSQLLKWGDFMMKIEGMEMWCALEVLTEGKTAFFAPAFSNSFCGLVDTDEDVAKYVLSTLTWCMSDEKWRKRVVDANAGRMKSIVKTLVLEFKWAKFVCESSKSKPIMSAEKQTEDFMVIETAFNRTEALQIKEDTTGKKANLHPLSLELWDMINKVLMDQTHFNTFQQAEAMNKNFQNTVQIESLQNLIVQTIVNPWKDAHVLFVGKEKKNKQKSEVNENEEEENKSEKAGHRIRLPTRKEALALAAKAEFELYHESSFVKTGDVTQDRHKMFQSELAKPRTAQNAQWNPETQGNRRVMMYDECGRRNPKWTYSKGRNKYRCKVSFQKDDFEDFVDTWVIMEKPGEGLMIHKVGVLMVWNAEQERASCVILKKMKSIPGQEGRVKKTVLKGVQHHVERRLWEEQPDGEVGELAGLPGMQEEIFEVFSGPFALRRKHLYPMGGITDNCYPEEIVPLRNPKKSEPVVSVEVQKAIFPPDDDKAHDGEKVVRSDEVWAPCHVCSCKNIYMCGFML